MATSRTILNAFLSSSFSRPCWLMVSVSQSFWSETQMNMHQVISFFPSSVPFFCWWWREVSFLDKSQSYSCIVCHLNFLSLSHKLEFWLEYSRLKCLLSGWFYSNPTTPHSTPSFIFLTNLLVWKYLKKWVFFSWTLVFGGRRRNQEKNVCRCKEGLWGTHSYFWEVRTAIPKTNGSPPWIYIRVSWRAF